MPIGVIAQMPDQGKTIIVDLKLRTGGALSGAALDHSDHGLVIIREGTPFVFAWKELEPGSAYMVRRALLDFELGGREHYSAEDYFQLGAFALEQGRTDLASDDFERARGLDRNYDRRAKEAFSAYAKKRREKGSAADESSTLPDSPPGKAAAGEGLLDRVPANLSGIPGAGALVTPSPPEIAAQVEDIYKTFGATVQRVISKNIVLIETGHFLIWTDWNKKYHTALAEQCEQMYRALCNQWGLDPGANIFLAKCPMFCFRAKARFRDFARQFDGHDVRNALGYTRSIEANGHVHVVLLRQGDEPADFDRFAVTLVHEGTHAFVHRLYTTRLIPHWVNEGYADLMAERVLQERCFTGENSALLAQQFVRRRWSIMRLLESQGPIEVHEYPLAQSVVTFLVQSNPQGFLNFFRGLKEGRSVGESLADTYDTMTIADLENQWRSWVSASMPPERESASPMNPIDP